MTDKQPITVKPWYREPWPWMIMGSLAVVITACFVTFYFAKTHWDGLVEDDYYKKGLEINQTMARIEKSVALSLTASLVVSDEGVVRVTLATPSADFVPPDTLTLKLIHPRYPDKDKIVMLHQTEGLTYSGNTAPPEKGRWRVLLETEAWRLVAEAQAPFESVTLTSGAEEK